ncbi:MAG: patatin-like phospholipase family protein [Acidobacteria bacterium]|nr:patatin-like phospholipase family protein [Acidobacteriota bacterium]
MTEGQQLALEQLREIEAASNGSVEIVSIKEWETDSHWVEVSFSLYCGNIDKAPGGLPLREREGLFMLIPPDFPFVRPIVVTAHTRFAGFPHVQWKRHLCLYQAPATEWDASDGMFGFISRLDLWLRKGALDELDPVGAPLHPPVAYLNAGTVRTVIPRVNTPSVGEDSWFGTAHLQIVSDYRVDICGWSSLFAQSTPRNVAASILLSQPMPFEFPTTVGDLFTELIERGVPLWKLILSLQAAVLSNDEEAPLYVIIGTPMRGIRGSGNLQQHLTAWYLEPFAAQALRIAVESYSENARLKEIGQRAEQLFLEWAKGAKVDWCSVREDRPQIVTRRDHSSPASWFAGRVVSLWGCGAIGGHVAEFLTRAGARKLILRDNKDVGPGIIVRQPYDDLDIGRPKAVALAVRLKRIRPDLEVEAHSTDILTAPLTSDDWTDGADVIIDATASEAVLAKLELKRHTNAGRRVPVISMVIGHRAEKSLVVFADAGHSGGPFDVVRRAKLEACSRPSLSGFADEFWPKDDAPRRAIFQPEPGCSDITYIGSEADAALLAGTMLNQVAADLANGHEATASVHFFTQPHAILAASERGLAKFHWQPDRVSVDPHSNYEIRISESAWSEMLAWANRSRRRNGLEVETGGLLFGERDDAARVIWVSEVSGPPPDSEASKDGFICGVVGTRELNAEKKSRTRGSVQYIGMWHSHPVSSPAFSDTDFRAMERLHSDSLHSPSKSLLLIIGTLFATPTLGAYVFSRSDFSAPSSDIQIRECKISVTRPRTIPRRIGLALSGGGSRAIAFHLGCLRALHDRGLLDQVEAISAISGGAVIAAMYGYSSDSFEEFDARVVEFLRRGLLGKLVRRTLLSPRLLGSIGAHAVAGTAALGADLLRMGLTVANIGATERREKVRAPLRRWVSRTTAFEDVLRDHLFGDLVLTSRRRGGIDVVLNACELRTGSAFRFGSRESGCWRFGRLVDNDVPVALAVAASAAYPLLLPAVDRSFIFADRKGQKFTGRVVLTDGGVFDNLGATCFEPGRSADIGFNTFCPEYIVCCDAGQGILSDNIIPYYWPSRMARSFEAVYRKANDGTRQRLHEYAASGKLKGFVLSYLGQIDERLLLVPPDLIKREEVYKYPTNFSPMKLDTIARLADRGEQLTRMLISRYCPEL